jgi:hypothetical protein
VTGVRVKCDIGIDYDTSIDDAEKLVREYKVLCYEDIRLQIVQRCSNVFVHFLYFHYIPMCKFDSCLSFARCKDDRACLLLA